ncbi:aminotransferase class IV [Luminiphilus sp.]|jgi:D-alanine transaminase|nr:aminotransferase class IV [Luminiphilus sp.]
MTMAYLNGEFLPLHEAKISPMDRGFLFGDGVYEVIPCYVGKTVALQYHMDRLRHSLHEIQLPIAPSDSDLEAILKELIIQNGNGNVGIYLQITRGVVEKRQHAFPERASPTVFAYTFPINPPSNGAADNATCFTTVTRADTRWARCHIKSTALLGNVLHMMEAVNEGAEEVLLFNEQDLLTEAAACNVFIVKDGQVLTPELDHQKLPGVTRRLCLELLEKYTDWQVRVGPVSREAVMSAEEVWLSSSTKELAPVIAIDGKPVADGRPGSYWSAAQRLFHLHRFDIN